MTLLTSVFPIVARSVSNTKSPVMSIDPTSATLLIEKPLPPWNDQPGSSYESGKRPTSSLLTSGQTPLTHRSRPSDWRTPFSKSPLKTVGTASTPCVTSVLSTSGDTPCCGVVGHCVAPPPAAL